MCERFWNRLIFIEYSLIKGGGDGALQMSSEMLPLNVKQTFKIVANFFQPKDWKWTVKQQDSMVTSLLKKIKE